MLHCKVVAWVWFVAWNVTSALPLCISSSEGDEFVGNERGIFINAVSETQLPTDHLSNSLQIRYVWKIARFVPL